MVIMTIGQARHSYRRSGFTARQAKRMAARCMRARSLVYGLFCIVPEPGWPIEESTQPVRFRTDEGKVEYENWITCAARMGLVTTSTINLRS